MGEISFKKLNVLEVNSKLNIWRVNIEWIKSKFIWGLAKSLVGYLKKKLFTIIKGLSRSERSLEFTFLQNCSFFLKVEYDLLLSARYIIVLLPEEEVISPSLKFCLLFIFCLRSYASLNYWKIICPNSKTNPIVTRIVKINTTINP